MSYYCCCWPEWVDASVDFCSCDSKESFNAALDAGENPCLECNWWRDSSIWGE